jgi:hypothetical protein
MENLYHTFHIPVLGLGYTVDTPVKVAKYGISSVMSIIEDGLVEKMREFHAKENNEHFEPIPQDNIDHRALRITAYLNLLDKIVSKQFHELMQAPFQEGSEIVKYFELLPDTSLLKKEYYQMTNEKDEQKKLAQQSALRKKLKPGSIDVNIMCKIDNYTYDKQGNRLPEEYCDAVAALRGYANSTVSSSIVFSAGYNPRLFNFLETFPDFYPDETGFIKKKIILKVSDFRSALIQGKILAKKGIWISEFRIESGLNCGGHAFPTDGYLLGPILEEFKSKRAELAAELFGMCNAALRAKGKWPFETLPRIRLTVQGGIGTAAENEFLIEHYHVDGTGWGSPFLLVPEATNVDAETLGLLATAEKEDYFVSSASPLGIPFQNFKKSSSETQRMLRIAKGRPGSPCYKKFLSSNTEFSEEPICTSSRQYQELKTRQLQAAGLPQEEYEKEIAKLYSRDCLCEGLTTGVLHKNHIPIPHNLNAVTICPGPNLAYFSGVFSLFTMVGHIYGRVNVLNKRHRKNMFINELELYVGYLKKTLNESLSVINAKQSKYFQSFRQNLLAGVEYYNSLIPQMLKESEQYRERMLEELNMIRDEICAIAIPVAMMPEQVHAKK